MFYLLTIINKIVNSGRRLGARFSFKDKDFLPLSLAFQVPYCVEIERKLVFTSTK